MTKILLDEILQEQSDCTLLESNISSDQKIPVNTVETSIDFNGIFSTISATTTKNEVLGNNLKLDILKNTENSVGKPVKSSIKKDSKKNSNLSSEVWNHFSMGTEGLSVMCKYCNRRMKRTDSSTKSMWGHLRSFHAHDVGPEVFEKKRNRRVFPKRLKTSANAPITSIVSLLNSSPIADLSLGNNCKDFDETLLPKRKRYRTKRIIALENQHKHNFIGGEGFDADASNVAAQLFFLYQLPSTSGTNLNYFPNGGDFDLMSAGFVESEAFRQLNCISQESHQSSESVEDATNRNSNNTTTTSSSVSPFDTNDGDANFANNSLLQNCVAALMLNNGLTALADNLKNENDGENINFMEELIKQFHYTQSSHDSNLTLIDNSQNQIVSNNAQNLLDAESEQCDPQLTQHKCNDIIVEKNVFSLGDPNSLFAMHQIAIDLNLTYLLYCRNGVPEYSFESNRAAQVKSESGRTIVLSERADKVHISERINGRLENAEFWAKTDLTQLMWAIRGKCQKSLCD